jgi:hypothetical protein
MKDKTRYNRLAQQKHRGSKRSFVTEIEDLKILLAWECGELSEGQVSKALKIDRISARKMRDDFVAEGISYLGFTGKEPK